MLRRLDVVHGKGNVAKAGAVDGSRRALGLGVVLKDLEGRSPLKTP
jgi:hypothetical protein